ncbi:helix-turn-helix transcriptional regulator [Mucilaginibacter gracilis]|nr:YafY family protein [Mucilaginibacter gracilis]
MNNKDTRRISRLTAILTQLQTKRMLTATTLAEKFGVSIRTIYRDIKVLEQAGVPIYTEDGKGYALLEGYRIPPVMFTQDEANALITVEQVVMKNSDSSLVTAYSEAINKIKAVLLYATKDKIELLANRIAISPAMPNTTTSNWLTMVQNALTSFKVLNITYRSGYKDETTERNIEPFALYYTLQENWSLIAYCRLRKAYRMFNLDRITSITPLHIHFEPHELTLASYLKDKEKNFQHP